MSVQAMSWVFEQSLSEGTDRLVLLAIADQARKDGTNAYPSIESIAKMANVSARTVQRAIRNLIDLGELRVERNAGGARDLRDDRRPNRYTVLMHGATDVSPRTDAERVRAARSRSCRAETDGATTVSPRDGDAARHVCHPVDGHGVTTEVSRGDNQRAHGVTQVSPDPREDPKDPNFAAAAHGAGTPKRTTVRPRDEIWDALVDALGHPGTMTQSERGRWNSAVKQLRDVDATPDEIRVRVIAYRRKWPNVACTPTALAAHWGDLAAKPATVVPLPQRTAATRPDCGRCAGTGWIPATNYDRTGTTGTVEPCPDCNRPHREAAR